MREFLGLLPYALVPYCLVVGVVYLVLVAVWKSFRSDDADLKLLWIPPVFYLGLDAVQDRQGLAAVFAIAITTLAVALSLPLKVVLRRVRPAVAIAAIGCLAALLSWVFLPRSGPDLPFP